VAPLSRHDRTARLLTDRLERLAVAVERGDTTGREVADRLDLASLATRHAVRLELLSPEEADSIWDAARRKHPAAFATRRR
jgi:hypothetical protein